ncbi:hypothetical protein NLG97_g3857 [Lecanicillium saksenae]|uniref:Uncharacterized protein n=1 Tax=Lecanicillium saksenae TaxID=468837 RepID=A0ACC1QYS9_9HYPO|nr:hypothetical protein NLG97_g3857 [Lecanicillium saksenae]
MTSVALLSQALVVALELGSRGLGVRTTCEASNLLLADATRAGNFCSARACWGFVAWSLAVAAILAAVLAKHFHLATSLTALSTLKRHIFALLAARFTTSCFLQVAGLTVQLFLSAGAPLVNQERTLWAASFFGVAVVLNRGMTTLRTAQTIESTFWRNRSARLGWLKHSPTAVAANFGEDGLGAARAGTAMANLLAIMTSAFQGAATGPDANMLGFYSCFGRRISVSTSGGLSFGSSLLASATNFCTFVSAAAHVGSAGSSTCRTTFLAFMADSGFAGSATATADIDLNQTAAAIAGMAF